VQWQRMTRAVNLVLAVRGAAARAHPATE